MSATLGRITPEELDILRNENHDAEVITIVAVFTTLALIATILRLTSRHLKQVAVGIDDLLIIVGLIISIAESIHIAVGVHSYGLGRHLITLHNEQVVDFQKLWHTVGALQPSALAVTKLSVLILYRRVFITQAFRISTWILGVVVLLWWIGTFFADVFICIPVERNWNPSIAGHCGNKQLVGIITPIPWIVTDLIILLMPLPMVWRLHLPGVQRVGLGGLFLLGGFALVSSCVRYSTLFFYHDDVTWYIIPATIWSVIEVNLTIISACLIVSRPWFLKIYPARLVSLVQETFHKLRTPRSNSYKSSSRGRRFPYFSSFVHITNSPPAITERSMGTPFDFDLEQNLNKEIVRDVHG